MKRRTKTTPSPAPATQPNTPPKAAPNAAAVAPRTLASPPKIVPPSAPAAPKGKSLDSPAAGLKQASLPAVAATVINARIDVGFGNILFIRGDGPGLNWEKGVPLKNLGSDHWQISLERAVQPVVFKLLINDETWSCGTDYTVNPGSNTDIKPWF